VDEFKKMRILVTGASGFFGGNLVKFLSTEHEVFGTYHSCKIKGLHYLDLSDSLQISQLIWQIKPDIIIHAACVTDVDYCETHKKEAFSVNVAGVKGLLSAADKKTRIIYLSSNYVFDGKKGDYSEYSHKNPINYYGTTKSVAEELIKTHKNHLIIRSGMFYGYNENQDKKNFLAWLLGNLLAQQKVKVVSDQVCNPTFIDDIAKITCLLVSNNMHGIIHIAGAETLTRLEFAYKIAAALNLNKSLIMPIKSDGLFPLAKRPLKINLSTKKMQKYGFSTTTIHDALIRVHS
jgi:dTDP-4-dehydrorhamnose reductase